MAAANIDKPILVVRHSSLQMIASDKPCRRWCPICDQGILLTRAVFVDDHGKDRAFPKHSSDRKMLSRADRCTLCGQAFWYSDSEIGGQPFFEAVTQVSFELEEESVPRTWHERILDDD